MNGSAGRYTGIFIVYDIKLIPAYIPECQSTYGHIIEWYCNAVSRHP